MVISKAYFILQVFVEQVKKHLPSGNFDDMIMILKKFLSFMNLTVSKILFKTTLIRFLNKIYHTALNQETIIGGSKLFSFLIKRPLTLSFIRTGFKPFSADNFQYVLSPNWHSLCSVSHSSDTVGTNH